MTDYIWCDGREEIVFNDVADALLYWKTKGYGKVWRRYFDDDGNLEGITMIEGSY